MLVDSVVGRWLTKARVILEVVQIIHVHMQTNMDESYTLHGKVSD